MRIGTTPTHTLTLPFDTETIAKVRVTYAQRDVIVLEKTEDDCRLEGNAIIVELSQEETLKFDVHEYVKLQAKVLTKEGKTLVSNKVRLSVGDALNKEVLL